MPLPVVVPASSPCACRRRSFIIPEQLVLCRCPNCRVEVVSRLSKCIYPHSLYDSGLLNWKICSLLHKRLTFNKLYWNIRINKFNVGCQAIVSIQLLWYTLCSKKSDAKIQITTTTSKLIRIKHPLSSFNYCLSATSVANFNKIHRTVYEQQPFKKWNSKTEVSNLENTS